MRLDISTLRRIIKEELDHALREAKGLNQDAVEAIKKHLMTQFKTEREMKDAVNALAGKLKGMGVVGEKALAPHVEKAVESTPGSHFDIEGSYMLVKDLAKAQGPAPEKAPAPKAG